MCAASTIYLTKRRRILDEMRRFGCQVVIVLAGRVGWRKPAHIVVTSQEALGRASSREENVLRTLSPDNFSQVALGAQLGKLPAGL